jgi:Glyoxalase/Bleomycin resistance protein/Dioxygenase superfamily
MALHSFLGMEIGVPEPAVLDASYDDLGLIGGAGHWGTADAPDQIDVVDAPYRQLRTMRLGCDDEADLAAIARRLDGLGIGSKRANGRLVCLDPSGSWRIAIEPAAPLVLATQKSRAHNRPGNRERPNTRADVVIEGAPRPPRRLGHVVLGSPDPVGTAKFFLEGIGFRLSDPVGVLSFMRCSTDHHNLLVQPGPIPYLNHYAFEFDDIDAVGAAATRYLAKYGAERHVVGLGRHVVGSNVFWYLTDPCGTMFECFSDMDDIPDDAAWEVRTDWPITEFATWGPRQPPEIFIIPPDLAAIAQARAAEGR